MIDIKKLSDDDPMKFDVTVREGAGETKHQVTMARHTYQKLTGGKVSPEQCIQAAFRFLLDREPKESILSRFDVTVISTYFPNFERDIAPYFKKSDGGS